MWRGTRSHAAGHTRPRSRRAIAQVVLHPSSGLHCGADLDLCGALVVVRNHGHGPERQAVYRDHGRPGVRVARADELVDLEGLRGPTLRPATLRPPSLSSLRCSLRRMSSSLEAPLAVHTFTVHARSADRNLPRCHTCFRAYMGCRMPCSDGDLPLSLAPFAACLPHVSCCLSRPLSSLERTFAVRYGDCSATSSRMLVWPTSS